MEKNEVIVCIDMDDTIENLCEAWVDYLNEKYGTHTKYTDLREWDVSKAFPTIEKNLIYQALHDTALWDTVKPKKDAQRYVKKLVDDGYSVYICTNTSYKFAQYKFDNVLFKYFPFLNRSNIIVTANKHLVCCDFLVDDYEQNLMGNNAKRKILFDTPHNRAFNEKSYGIKRTKSWKTIYDEITNYYECQNVIAEGRG